MNSGNLEPLKAFLRANPQLIRGKEDVDGATFLHAVAYRGNKQLTEFLIANKADVNAETKLTIRMPLHLAARGGHAQVVKALLAAKAKANGRHGDTPLHEAVKAGPQGGGGVPACCKGRR